MRAVLALLLLASALCADALVVTQAMGAETIAEIFIERDAVRVELEIGLGDLAAFAIYLPPELQEKLGLKEPPSRSWQILADGKRLEEADATLRVSKRLQRDKITGEAAGESDELVANLSIRYALAQRPRTITLGSPSGVTIGFVLYDDGLPVNDFRYLPAEATVDLDPADPWYSSFRHRNLKRRFDAPMSAFLYMEPYEVRKEIVVRPRDLQAWVDLGLGDSDTIPAASQAEIKRKAADFLAQHAPVTVDGEPAEFVLDRIHFVRRTLRRTGVIDPPEDLPLSSATLGVIFVHARGAELPRKVAMTWDLFSERIQSVPTVATDEAGGMPGFLTPEDPVVTWENFLKNPTRPGLVEIVRPREDRMGVPWYSIAIAGVAFLFISFRRKVLGAICIVTALAVIPLQWDFSGSRPSEERCKPIVGGLLRNVYSAFDFRGESVIYDALARSVSGEVLQSTYLQTRHALELQNQGGARVKVKKVELSSCDPRRLDGKTGFGARCKWTVEGSVGHWGHIHTRSNEYLAEIEVRPVEGEWKITALELVGEERVE